MAEFWSRNGSLPDESRYRGISRLNQDQRYDRLMQLGIFTPDDIEILNAGLPPETADTMIENRVGTFGTPIGVVVGVPVNNRIYDAMLVAIEEPSVDATLNSISGLVRREGTTRAEVLGNGTIGQIQIDYVENPEELEAAVMAYKESLIAYVNTDIIPSMVARGGGMTDLRVRHIPISDDGTNMAVVEVIIDTCDAMGANIVNQVCEKLQDPIEEITGKKVNLRILSNLATERLATAEIALPGFDPEHGSRIARASLFAKHDPWRATTHNKGIMNGITAISLVTGNDTRADAAGAHAYAARDGQYRGLSEWRMDDGALVGTLTMPMDVGTVGGITRIHPQVLLAQRLLGHPSADELAKIMVSAGLMQNLGALKALTSPGGISEGHMNLAIRGVVESIGAGPGERDYIIQYLRNTLATTGRVSETEARIELERLRSLAQLDTTLS